MSSFSKRLLIGCGALLAPGLLIFFVSADRERAARGELGAAAAAPERTVPAELVTAVADEERAREEGAGTTTRSELPVIGAEGAAAATGAFLRLIERDDRSALADYPVRIVFGETPQFGRRIAWKESDGGGLIDVAEYAKGSSGDAEAFVFPSDCRMRFEPPSLTLAQLGRTAAQAPRLVLLARDSARLSGRALDATSGEPLAALALRVSDWAADPPGDDPAARTSMNEWTRCGFSQAKAPWMVTDAEGRFEAPETYPAGRLRLITPHQELAEVVLDEHGTAVEARFDVGPLLLLDFHAPGGRTASDFIAALYRDPSEAGLDEELHDALSPWTPADWEHARGNAAAVRPGSPPWARLAADEREHPLPSFVILVSRDGAAKGAARIDEFERHRRQPLFVDVRELGALAGKVRDEGLIPRSCELRLRASDATEDDEPLGSRWLSAGGSFLFQGLAAGSYRLELRVAGIEPLTFPVSVPAPAPLELVVPATASEERHAFSGRITSASGLPLDGKDGRASLTYIHMSSMNGQGGSARVSWSGGVGTFRREGLLPGEYRLNAQFDSGMVEIEPDRARVSVPGTPPELRARDDVRLQHLELWITAPSPARELAIKTTFEGVRRRTVYDEVSAGDPPEVLPDGRAAQRMVLGPYPIEAFTSLTVSGEGLLTARLDAQDFVATGALWRAEIGLVAGWSVQLQVYDEARESVAGIVLALDGVALAASDTEGAIQVERESKPARLSVATPGWELVEHHSWDDWGTVFESGEFTVEDGNLDVFLRKTR